MQQRSEKGSQGGHPQQPENMKVGKKNPFKWREKGVKEENKCRSRKCKEEMV